MDTQTTTVGKAIDVDGDYVIVGARKTKIGTKQNAGEVYIYKNNNDNWNRVKKLSLSNPTANYEFGYGLSIKNDIIAVGVPGKNNGNTDDGIVLLYQKDEGGTDNWGNFKTLTASDGASYDKFGSNIVMKNGFIFICAFEAHSLIGNTSDTGAVYIFENKALSTSSLFNIEQN